MTEVGAYEAKTHLPRLLQEVAQGRTVTITRHGKPVARLVPVREGDGDADDVVREIKRVRERVMLGEDLTVAELIREGRR